MNINSRLFDSIRIGASDAEAPLESDAPRCDHPGCARAGEFRAPKGRGREGQFLHFCLEHVKAYNASYNYFAGMSDEVQKRWSPNCEVEGGRNVRLQLAFTLGAGGQVDGKVDAQGAEHSSDPVVKAAAERAIRAVYAAAPFTRLPRNLYGQRFKLNFRTSEACS